VRVLVCCMACRFRYDFGRPMMLALRAFGGHLHIARDHGGVLQSLQSSHVRCRYLTF
jgi:hypothetical protein